MSKVSESSRRAFLTALAASGAAATVLPGVSHAQSSGASGVGVDTSPVAGSGSFSTEAFPATVPGTNYTFLLGSEFQPTLSGTTFVKDQGQISSTGTGIFYHALNDLPTGARITEVTFAVLKSAGYPGDVSCFAYRLASGTISFALDNKNSTSLAQLSTEQYISLTVAPDDPDWVIDNELGASHWLVATMLNGNGRLNSVRVGWTLPHPRTFIPIDPKRVYDSRVIAPLGPLGGNATRVISVANGYTVSTATVDLPDVVPAGAKAIAYNLTITKTVGSGFLAVAPGDATALGASSINWFTSGMTLANGLVVKLDSNRQVKVFCGGGGSTEFIIDVLGYHI
ncbi:MAG: twin-arginine translocation signal domain-containing protein [Ilumatobacteraceae bacterium]